MPRDVAKLSEVVFHNPVSVFIPSLGAGESRWKSEGVPPQLLCKSLPRAPLGASRVPGPRPPAPRAGQRKRCAVPISMQVMSP